MQSEGTERVAVSDTQVRIRARLGRVASAAVALISGASFASGVLPDGGSATSVTVGPDGRTTVGLAGTVGGVSVNTFRHFNVPRGGVDLDNRGVGARTILNQVTGTDRSLLEGQLTVLGPRANVVIANPNGVSVNGMVVQNVGNLAVTTGQVTFNDFTTANGSLQRNLVLNTSSGAIDIGPEGLSGTLLNLELAAKQIRVGGKVENLYGDPGARIRAVAGDSRAEIDTSISPTDNRTPWIHYVVPSVTAGHDVALDITASGSLIAGRIELLVTDQGAGVRHAGNALATAGDFVVSATGDLQLIGGTIRATKDAVIASGGLIGTGDAAAGRHLQLSSDRVRLNASTLAAGTAEVGDLVIGTGGQVHTEAVGFVDTTMTASGGIGIFDAGQGVTMEAVRARAGANLIIEAAGSTGLTRIDGSGLIADGALSVRGAGAVSLHQADLDGISATAIYAGSLLMRASSVQSSGGAVSLTAAGSHDQQDSDVLAASDIRLRAGTVSVSSASRQATIIANGGGVLLESRGALTNRGALIQGRKRVGNDDASSGAVTLNAGATFLNESTPDYMGIVFGAEDDVVVKAGGDVVNHHARMLSNGLLYVEAAGDIRNETTKQAGANGEQPRYFSESARRWLWLSKRTAGFDVDYGTLARPAQTAYLLSEKGTTLRGRNVLNQGGEIYANNGDISVQAALSFRTEGIATGAAHYSRTCMIVCRTSASSTTTVTGGLLSAGGNIDIRAGESASNIGGRVLALGDLDVVAPVTFAGGIMGYTALARDRGFKAFLGDTWARLYAADVGGNWIAGRRGRVVGDTIIDGGSFDGSIEVAGATTVIRPRQRVPVSVESHLGMTSWLWR